MIENKEVLITGGTGSLAGAVVELLKTEHKPRGIRIFSRGELKQSEMKAWVKQKGWDDNISFLIGDVRDKDRLSLACKGVDIIIHAAAIKRVEVAEDDPLECVKTNIHGTENVIYAAIDNQVQKVFFISTDKAVYPTTLYGSTKKCAEDLIIRADAYSGRGGVPTFSCARYGNVIGSNGSVVRLFRAQEKTGQVTITHPKMTRFWISLDKVARFIIDRIEDMEGGEVFVPKTKAMKVTDIAYALAPDAKQKIIGIRGQEKLHETLITEEESRYASENQDFFTIKKTIKPKENTFIYASNTTTWKMTPHEFLKIVNGD